MVELSERTANAMQENFSNYFFDAMTGELENLADYLDAFTQTILRAMADMAGQATAQYLFSGITPAAHGDIFSGPGIAAYENTVVKQPTLVALAKGAALIGEAGDEAVMPLGRTASGDLGVKVAGDQREPIKVEINPVNDSGIELAVEPRIMQQSPDKLVADMVIKQKMTSRNFRRRM
jgi:phage-related minor tail protein